MKRKAIIKQKFEGKSTSSKHYQFNTNFEISREVVNLISKIEGVAGVYKSASGNRYEMSLYIGICFADSAIVKKVRRYLKNSATFPA